MSSKNTGKGGQKAPGIGGYEEVVATGKETVEAAVKASTEAATKAFAMGKDRVEQVVKSYDELANFNKGNVDAFVTAGNVAVKGIEAINAEVMAFSKSSIEDSIAAAKAVMSAKTLNEFVELQSRFAKTTIDSFLQQSTKLGELSAKVAQESFEPINARVQVAVEKFVKPIAA
ncbi:MAG: phasin family protein [Alphaproteobacteria bacterium]|nr:phasin family protein [Alphaproteobacteria bacterium]